MYIDWNILWVVVVIKHKVGLSAPLLVNVKQRASLPQFRGLQAVAPVVACCLADLV